MEEEGIYSNMKVVVMEREVEVNCKSIEVEERVKEVMVTYSSKEDVEMVIMEERTCKHKEVVEMEI